MDKWINKLTDPPADYLKIVVFDNKLKKQVTAVNIPNKIGELGVWRILSDDDVLGEEVDFTFWRSI